MPPASPAGHDHLSLTSLAVRCFSDRRGLRSARNRLDRRGRRRCPSQATVALRTPLRGPAAQRVVPVASRRQLSSAARCSAFPRRHGGGCQASRPRFDQEPRGARHPVECRILARPDRARRQERDPRSVSPTTKSVSRITPGMGGSGLSIRTRRRAETIPPASSSTRAY